MAQTLRHMGRLVAGQIAYARIVLKVIGDFMPSGFEGGFFFYMGL